MVLPLVGMAVGAGLSLLSTAIADLMQSDEPDPAKIQAVKDAQKARFDELVSEGMDRPQAYLQAKKETADEMEKASEVTDQVTAKDYIASGALGAAAGAIPFGAIAKGAGSLAGKARSFLGGKAPVPTESVVGGLRTRAPAAVAEQQASSRNIKDAVVKDFTERNAPKAAVAPKDPVDELQSIMDDVLADASGSPALSPPRGLSPSVNPDWMQGPDEAARVAAMLRLAKSTGRV